MQDKIKTIPEIREIIFNLRKEGKRIVFTNGCFDVLHIGHVRYLNEASNHGTLIVAINSDSSVRLSKGPTRPINHQENRAEMLASLGFVSYVFVFEDKTVENLLREIKPEVYAKGGDYTIFTINQDERKIVEGYGGKILIIPAQTDNSTTKILKKIEELE